MFLSKSRKLSFQVDLTVNSLENVPLLDGLFYVKLKLNRSASAMTDLVSPRSQVVEHTVIWKWDASFKVNMSLSEDNVVMPCAIRLVVKKDRAQEKRSEQIGCVFLDLGHFVGSKSSSSKHLLQDSRINSLLKITVTMTQLKGILDFKVPNVPPELQIDISRVTRGLITASPNSSFVSLDSDYISAHNSHASEGHPTPPSKLHESKSYMSLNAFSHPTLIKPHLQIPIPFPHLPNLDSRSPSLVVEDLVRKVIQSDACSASKTEDGLSSRTSIGATRFEEGGS